MSIHRYKQVQPRPDTSPSVRELVKKWGDSWIHFAPLHFKHELTHDATDAALMRMMERGTWPRV